MPPQPIKSLPLLGDLIEDFPKSETLPTNGQAVLLLTNYVRNKGLTISEASTEIVKKLFEIWNNKADRPPKLIPKRRCKQRLISYYKKFHLLKQKRKKKRKSLEKFISFMNETCDLAQFNSRELAPNYPTKRPPTPPQLPEKRARRSITNVQYVESEMSDSDDEEDTAKDQDSNVNDLENDEDEYVPGDDEIEEANEENKSKSPRFTYITDEICASFIESNMSIRSAFKKCKQDIIASGGDPNDYVISHTTIAERLAQYRAKLASKANV